MLFNQPSSQVTVSKGQMVIYHPLFRQCGNINEPRVNDIEQRFDFPLHCFHGQSRRVKELRELSNPNVSYVRYMEKFSKRR